MVVGGGGYDVDEEDDEDKGEDMVLADFDFMSKSNRFLLKQLEVRSTFAFPNRNWCQ